MRSLPVQLVKGGKHTFGWSAVKEPGTVAIPPEAIVEYGLEEGEKLIVLPGSRTSGGFALASPKSVSGSVLGDVLEKHPELGEFRIPEGERIEHKNRSFCWVQLRRAAVHLIPQTLERYGIRIGDRLLVLRGSGLAVGFAVRGPIVQEARKHKGLPVHEYKE
jgi:hypothetical protein